MVDLFQAMLLAGAVVQPFVPENRIVDQFDAAQVTLGDHENEQVVSYRLHRPRAIEAGRRYPLLVWLHGARERGDDNLEQLRWMELVFEALPPEEHDYYILAYQCPPDETSWYHGHRDAASDDMNATGMDSMTVAMKILDHVVADEPVDEDRVYVSGVSGGGTACWEMAMRYPDRFAAIVPLASGGGDPARLERITHVPVWAFYSLRDEVPADAVGATVEQLKKIGGSAHLTLIDNAKHGIQSVLYEHDCWTGAIKYYDAMQWLFGQRRGALFSLPPGFRVWPWWNYAALGSMAAICAAVWHFERRRRAALGAARPARGSASVMARAEDLRHVEKLSDLAEVPK